MRRIVTGPRLAIRVDADTLLAVPPIHPGTPKDVRARILEYVLRRQPGMAHQLAEDVAEDIRRTDRRRRDLLGTSNIVQLLAEEPHHTDRRAA